MTAPVDDRGKPGRADGDADRTAPPRAAETVADDDRDRYAIRGNQLFPQRAGGGIGVDWQQQDALIPIPGRDIRVVDPGIGHYPAAAVFGDDQVLPMPNNPFRLRQYDLDKARIFTGF